VDSGPTADGHKNAPVSPVVLAWEEKMKVVNTENRPEWRLDKASDFLVLFFTADFSGICFGEVSRQSDAAVG
jgi:hypothetical protein